MASLIQLSKTPEVLYLILSYLGNRDLVSVLQTCKAIYPACYIQLWSYLDLPWQSGASDLAKRVKKDGADKLGFKHTQFLHLYIFDWYKPLAKLLETGKLNPRTVSLELQCGDTGEMYYYSLEDSVVLLELIKYSKTKTPKEFSIYLKASIVRDIPKILDLEKITRYELLVHYHESETRQTWSITDDSSTVEHIKELTKLLSQLVNLQYFSWNTHFCKYNVFKLAEATEISEELKKLQNTFTNMRYLKTLVLSEFLFHPSFFLTPPESVRTLEIGGDLSPTWWRQFAACPFPGLETLKMQSPEYPYFEMEAFVDAEEAAQKIDKLFLKEVAVTSLKSCALDDNEAQVVGDPKRWYLPADITECIYQKNKMLRPDFRRSVACNRANMLTYKAIARFQEKILNAKSPVSDSYAREIANRSESVKSVDRAIELIFQELLEVPEHCSQGYEYKPESKSDEEWEEIQSCAWDLVCDGASSINDKLEEVWEDTKEKCVEQFLNQEDVVSDELAQKWLERLAKDARRMIKA